MDMQRRHQSRLGMLVLTASSLGLVAPFAQTSNADDSVRVFKDNFANGEKSVNWRPYPPFGDSVVQSEQTDNAPDGDGKVGVLRHQGDGRATISYADAVKAENTFDVEAYIYCPREAEPRMGSLTGIAFYLPTNELETVTEDRAEDQGFYRLVCDYRFGDAGFSLAYIGANIDQRPLEMEYWPLLSQEFGTDTVDDWPHIRVHVDLGSIEVYLDGAKLNERPLAAERVVADIANVDAGYAGIYAGHMGGGTPDPDSMAEARVDGFSFQVR